MEEREKEEDTERKEVSEGERETESQVKTETESERDKGFKPKRLRNPSSPTACANLASCLPSLNLISSSVK